MVDDNLVLSLYFPLQVQKAVDRFGPFQIRIAEVAVVVVADNQVS